MDTVLPPLGRNARAHAVALVVLLAAACGTSAPVRDPSQASANSPSPASAPSAAPSEQARGAVRLSTDKQTYITREPMTLRVHNEMYARIDVMGSLGALRGWRADGAQEPWQHGFKETTELMPVKPGETMDLGPVSAPDRVGRYVLEISYLDPAGVRSAVRTEIEVQAGTSGALRTLTPTQAQGSTPAPAGVVRLVPLKTAYAARQPMTFRVANDTKSTVWLRSSLGGLRGWRLTTSANETWNHGLLETQVLLEIRAGQFVDLTQIPAPEKVGDYLAQITYYTGSGATGSADGRFSVK